MWRTENLLRADGCSIVGTGIRGRHFFVHPRDTCGVLLESTDDEIVEQRQSAVAAHPVSGSGT